MQTRPFAPLRFRPLALALAVAGVLAACSVAPGSPAPGSPTQSPGGPVDATGDWRLTAGSDGGTALVLVEGRDVTLTVAGSQVSGRSACNQYGGEIIVAEGRIRFGPLSMTEMACEEPVMSLEAAYLAALAKVAAATRDGDTLTLIGDGVALTYERLAPPPTADIVDTDWTLDSLITGDAVSSVGGDPAHLRLGSDGSVTGSTGCRVFTGRYTETNGEIVVTELSMDQSVCPAALAAQDDHVVAVLGDGFRAAVDGQRLTLSAPGNEGLGYITATPAS